MIEISHVTKKFGDVAALRDVSFSVKKGQVVGFLGANGAGKTTTMDIICGVVGADSGTVTIDGFEIANQPIEAKSRIGYLPDVAPLYPEMFVEDFVDFSARIHRVNSKERSRRVRDTLEKLNLGDVRRRLIGNLSKGYRQRVALAQAIVHDPAVLILDEPTEGLDPNQIVQIRDLIRSLAGQHTILLSSHILSEVEQICNHIVIIHKGKIVQQGSYDALLSHMESGGQYRLRVAREAGRLARELGTLAGVKQSSPDPEENDVIDLMINGADGILDKVAMKVVDGGFGLKELSLKTKTLEDVFFQLTK